MSLQSTTMFLFALLQVTDPDAPVGERLVVDRDNVRIERSCTVEIAADVIEDTDGDGVIQITGDGIVVDFGGTALRGARAGRMPDAYDGYGVRITGRNVTLRNAKISGFWCGVYATGADGLTLDGIDASDNRRARLGSTPQAEDGADWLFPHRNDGNEWLNSYGAAIYIEASTRVTVRDCVVHHGQNGLILDQVNDSRVYDNDFSFNSGWGIAMWRSSRNVISRNACDFCVRGYSHGVYNRGQDSAGILMFEQNNGNVIAENSATHGGDGFFGFAGREALGETWVEQARAQREAEGGSADGPIEIPDDVAAQYKRRGNSDNLLIGNDFSFAPAHGIEMTFSFGNKFLRNRLEGNAICGVWGGYSQDTLIAGNAFLSNGEMGYGLERGGVNIEHSRDNRIVANRFEGNRCGVHLWWDPDGPFGSFPWAKANTTACRDNLIAGNTFDGDELAFHLRLVAPGDDPDAVCEATIAQNQLTNVAERIRTEGEVGVHEPETADTGFNVPEHRVYGERRPVGARPELRGRDKIIMTEWGPWDHASPLVRTMERAAGRVVYELRKLPGELRTDADGDVDVHRAEQGGVHTLRVESSEPGVHPYTIRLASGDFERALSGVLIASTWEARFFGWPAEVDPREKLDAWRKLAERDDAVRVDLERLILPYGGAGPGKFVKTAATLGGDHFGMIARTALPLEAGTWRFVTRSDDGVRVAVDGKPVIENWTWHPPERDTGTLTLEADRTVEIVVEHFEIDGFAVLELEIERVE